MIYCIWYPSGGFGHFVNAVISLHGNGFSRPAGSFSLGYNGNSHPVPLTLPKYKNTQITPYELPTLDSKINYTVLVDNGINDESQGFLLNFPGAEIIKICYDDWSWPVVAHTHVTKAMNSVLNKEIFADFSLWPENEAWSQREKFFLYLRDHDLRHQWRPNDHNKVLKIDQFKNYDSMYKALEDIGIELEDFNPEWNQWWQHNQIYFESTILAEKVISAIEEDTKLELSTITDIWTQAVIYYFIWLHFGREVPHNDFAEFFTNTSQIRSWLQL